MSGRRPGDERPETMGYTTRGSAWEWRQSWSFLFFLTFFGYWVPLVYMGLRVLQFRWVIYGLFYAGPVVLLGLVLASGGAGPDGMRFSGGTLSRMWQAVAGFWMVALIHSWSAREEFLMRLSEQQFEHEDLVERARSRMAATDEAPAEPRRLLNINSIGETELAMLPGLGSERAKQAMRLREELGDYRSFADFAAKLQLPDAVQKRLRPLFEPDSEAVAPAIRMDDPAYRLLADGSRVLELNWASAEALGALPGLGPEVARRAVTMRDGDGPFKSLEDFRFRLGLSMDVLIKISPHVSVISSSTRPGGGERKAGGRIVDV